MIEFTLGCISGPVAYKAYSDKIVGSCGKDAKTPLEVQKGLVDKIKEVIKAGPKRHPAIHKFFSLKLLNKVILKKNPELNAHV